MRVSRRRFLLIVSLAVLLTTAGCSRYIGAPIANDSRVGPTNVPTLECDERIGQPNLAIIMYPDQTELEVTVMIFRTKLSKGNTTIWYEETFKTGSEVWFNSSSVDIRENETYNAVIYTNDGEFTTANFDDALRAHNRVLQIKRPKDEPIDIQQLNVLPTPSPETPTPSPETPQNQC